MYVFGKNMINNLYHLYLQIAAICYNKIEVINMGY